MQGEQPYRRAKVVAAFVNVASVLHPHINIFQHASTNYYFEPAKWGWSIVGNLVSCYDLKGNVANGGNGPNGVSQELFGAYPRLQLPCWHSQLRDLWRWRVMFLQWKTCTQPIAGLKKSTSQNWLPRQDWMKSWAKAMSGSWQVFSLQCHCLRCYLLKGYETKYESNGNSPQICCKVFAFEHHKTNSVSWGPCLHQWHQLQHGVSICTGFYCVFFPQFNGDNQV